MNGCSSVFEIHDPDLGESAGVACHGNHAPGEPHRAGIDGRITWTDAEAMGTVEPMGDPRMFVAHLPPAAGTWSNLFGSPYLAPESFANAWAAELARHDRSLSAPAGDTSAMRIDFTNADPPPAREFPLWLRLPR
jgi:hypothetical protein